MKKIRRIQAIVLVTVTVVMMAVAKDGQEQKESAPPVLLPDMLVV